MKPLDDMLPEENEPQYKELITLLQHSYSDSAPISLERQQQIISQVRARLKQASLENSSTNNKRLPVLGTMNSSSHKSKRLLGKYFLNTLVAALLMLVLFGTTLLFLRSGLSTIVGSSTSELSLQVTPSTVPVGGIITLHGSNFHPNTHVGLMRDSEIAIIDRSSHDIISADGSGSFSDTVFVDSSWGAGPHTIIAEDANSHTTASFPIMVLGHGESSRPPHLSLSLTSLALGSGDQATNSTATMSIADSGGGVISWQSATTQPWLVLSPQHGTFPADQPMTVTVAVDRSHLAPGSYSGDLLITSNAGNATVSVTMTVTPLQAQNESILQVDPAALSFTATDGGANPPSQTVTLSNPGVQPLQWGSSTSTINGGANSPTQSISISNTGGQSLQWNASTSTGANWLSVSPPSGNVAPQGGSESVKISVNTSDLLPGVYRSKVTFSDAGTQQVQDSPQSVFVSLTILSQSPVFKVSPTSLTFNVTTGTSSQPITISDLGNQPLNWNAALASGAPSFVSLSSTSGSNLAGGTSTVTNIVVNAAGITSNQTFTISVQVSATDPSTDLPTAGSPATVSLTITNTGGDSLNWAVGAPSLAAGWLGTTPHSGSDKSGASSQVTFFVDMNGLNPGSYATTVTITPSVGSPVTINIALIVNGAAPTPLPTPNVTPGPSPTDTPSPQPSPSRTDTPTPLPTPNVTAAGSVGLSASSSANVEVVLKRPGAGPFRVGEFR